MTEKQLHSRFGIASCLIALGQCLSALACVLTPMCLGHHGVTRAVALTIGLVLIAGFVGNLTGIVLGILGVRQQGRTHTFAFIGLVANVALPLLLIALIVLANVLSKNSREGRTTIKSAVANTKRPSGEDF